MENVIVIEPNFVIKEESVKQIDLPFLNKTLKGSIEIVPYFSYFDKNFICVYVNEEGKLNAMKDTVIVYIRKKDGSIDIVDVLVGTIVILGFDEHGNNLGLSDFQKSIVFGKLESCELLDGEKIFLLEASF